MRSIELHGLASGKVTILYFSEADLQTNLLTWLRKNQVTVASSCDGQGVCKKCVIQNDWPTCLMTLEEFIQRQPDRKIFISYL